MPRIDGDDDADCGIDAANFQKLGISRVAEENLVTCGAIGDNGIGIVVGSDIWDLIPPQR